MTLNDKQLEAVNHTEGPCLVLAGAGSGKTRVLTERIIKLIDDGVSPHNILAITFTNKAAKEMRVRVQNKIGDVANSIFIGTFHSFGLRILRENYDAIGYSSNITILDTDDTKSLIKRILKENSFDPADYDIKHIISKISSAKNDGISPLEFSKLFLNEHDKVIRLVYEKYLKLYDEKKSEDKTMQKEEHEKKPLEQQIKEKYESKRNVLNARIGFAGHEQTLVPKKVYNDSTTSTIVIDFGY